MSKMAEIFTAKERLGELLAGFDQCSQDERVDRVFEIENDLAPVLQSYYGHAEVGALIQAAFGAEEANIYLGYKADEDRFDPDISGWIDDEEMADVIAAAQEGADRFDFSPFACLAHLQLRDQ